MPPLTCPTPPRPHPEDCPLYAQRLAYDQDESLRRAVLSEHHRSPGLAGLIRAEQPQAAPAQPALPPAPEPVPLPILDQLQKEAK